MTRRVLLVDGDLLALSRVEAAARAAGAELQTCATKDLDVTLAANAFDYVFVDLDRGGKAALDAVGRVSGAPSKVVGFFSHVDEDIKAAARDAGVDAWPRGRLWRSLGQLLSP